MNDNFFLEVSSLVPSENKPFQDPFLTQTYGTLIMALLFRKTCLVGLLIHSILRGNNCRFSSTKSNELTDQQDMFCFNHAYVFYTSNTIMKNVDEYRI